MKIILCLILIALYAGNASALEAVADNEELACHQAVAKTAQALQKSGTCKCVEEQKRMGSNDKQYRCNIVPYEPIQPEAEANVPPPTPLGLPYGTAIFFGDKRQDLCRDALQKVTSNGLYLAGPCICTTNVYPPSSTQNVFDPAGPGGFRCIVSPADSGGPQMVSTAPQYCQANDELVERVKKALKKLDATNEQLKILDELDEAMREERPKFLLNAAALNGTVAIKTTADLIQDLVAIFDPATKVEKIGEEIVVTATKKISVETFKKSVDYTGTAVGGFGATDSSGQDPLQLNLAIFVVLEVAAKKSTIGAAIKAGKNLGENILLMKEVAADSADTLSAMQASSVSLRKQLVGKNKEQNAEIYELNVIKELIEDNDDYCLKHDPMHARPGAMTKEQYEAIKSPFFTESPKLDVDSATGPAFNNEPSAVRLPTQGEYDRATSGPETSLSEELDNVAEKAVNWIKGLFR